MRSAELVTRKAAVLSKATHQKGFTHLSLDKLRYPLFTERIIVSFQQNTGAVRLEKNLFFLSP